MSNYRIFISYSRESDNLVNDIEEVLTAKGFQILRDKHLPQGLDFFRQIQSFIEHAHLFLPVITSHSINSQWVHQEIGYS